MEKHSIFQTRQPSAGNEARCASSLVVASGQEVFVACGSIIRWADLACKDFLELKTPEIDFEIHRLVLNRTRSILVAVGLHQVVALFVPRISVLSKRDVIRGHLLGEHQLRKSQIVDVKLHPLSAADNAVVVLTQDGTLRLYDLNLSFKEAELQVSVFKQPTRGYGDFDESEAVAFTFGFEGDGWTCLTVFVLMLNGDIYSILPFMPDSCALSHEAAAAFEQHAVIEAGTASAAGYSKLLTAIDHGARLSSRVTFTRPAKLLAPVVIGPCLLSPAPLEFSTHEVSATSLVFLPSQPVNVLAVASEGKVDLCLVGPLVPNQKDEVTFAVHESIQINGAPLLEASSTLSFFARHEHGLHKIELTWLETLAEAYETSDLLAEEMMASGVGSTVTKLLDAEGRGTAGLATVEHNLDQSLIVLTTGSVHEILLTTLSLDELDLGDRAITPESSEAHYKSLLTTPAYRPSTLARGPKIAVPAALQGSTPLVSSLETLRFLSKVATQVRKEIENLFHAVIVMHRRLQVQLQEQDRQREKLAELAQQLHQLTAVDGETGRHTAACERQAHLEARATALLQKLRQGHAPQLSMAEKRYFEELKRVEGRLRGQAGLLHRCTRAKQQFERVSAATAAWAKTGQGRQETVSSPLKVNQTKRLQAQLDTTQDLLSKTREKVERLLRVSDRQL